MGKLQGVLFEAKSPKTVITTSLPSRPRKGGLLLGQFPIPFTMPRFVPAATGANHQPSSGISKAMNMTGFNIFASHAAKKDNINLSPRTTKREGLGAQAPWTPRRSPHNSRSSVETRRPTTPVPTETPQASQSASSNRRKICTLSPGHNITDYFEFPGLLPTLSPAKCDQSAESAAAEFLHPHFNPASHGVPNLRGHTRPLLLAAREKSSNMQCVAKVLQKAAIPPSAGGERLWRELCERILACPSHPNLLPFYGIFEDSANYFLFFERLEGGELFDFLLTESAVPEELCKHLVRQILLALEFLHSKSIIHRDVKPENLMFRQKRPRIDVSNDPAKSLVESLPSMLQPYELVLIDFDTCRMMDYRPDDYKEWTGGRRRLVGTYGYLAPEILRGGEYSAASDLWSVGIILYILMTGIPPVPMGVMKSARESQEALAKLQTKGIGFDFPPLLDFPLARDLIMRLLDFDPARRMQNATAALQHPWLLSSAALSAKYYCASPLASLMPQTVAHQLSRQPIPTAGPHSWITASRSHLSLPPVLPNLAEILQRPENKAMESQVNCTPKFRTNKPRRLVAEYEIYTPVGGQLSLSPLQGDSDLVSTGDEGLNPFPTTMSPTGGNICKKGQTSTAIPHKSTA